jgi:polysaccharide biosynthesis protein PslH
MKIMFLCYRIPFPSRSGERLRSNQLINILSKQHEVSIVFLSLNKQDFREFQQEMECINVKVYCILLKRWSAILRAVGSIFCKDTPLQVGYYHSSDAHKQLVHIASKEKIDILYVQLARMGDYYHKGAKYKQYIDYMDAFSEFYKSRAATESDFSLSKYFSNMIDLLEARRMKRYEVIIKERFDMTTIISQYDALLVDSEDPPIVVPNYTEFVADSVIESIKKKDLSVIFFGEMSTYYSEIACIIFVSKILPVIRNYQGLEKTSFYIVGANPTKKIQDLAQLDHVYVTGYVKDINSYIISSTISVAPIWMGSGLKNKIIQAMGCKVPVVASLESNKGVNAANYESILLSDDYDEFAMHCINLLKDSSYRTLIAERGFQFVQENFSYQSVENKLIRVFNPDDRSK